MSLLLGIILAYLIGSIPTGLWLGQHYLGVDLREHGSGNLGATNAFRVLGKKMGATVLFIDVLKGLAPVVFLPPLLGVRATPENELIIGCSAVAGHVFSMFVNFRGGKGVATALGVFLAIAPGEMLAVLALGIGIIVTTGYVSAAAVVGALLLPFLLYFSGRPAVVLLVSCIIAAIVLVRHKSNILRLFAGRENRLSEAGPTIEDRPIPHTRSTHQSNS